MMMVHRLHYWRNAIYVVDLAALLTSLVFEVFYMVQMWGAMGDSTGGIPTELLIITRSWRFVRLANHGLVNKRVGIVNTRRLKRIEVRVRAQPWPCAVRASPPSHPVARLPPPPLFFVGGSGCTAARTHAAGTAGSVWHTAEQQCKPPT